MRSRIPSRMTQTDRKRRIGVSMRSATPKRVLMTGAFCKYGRVYSNPGSRSTDLSGAGSAFFIVPIGGNKNNNWRT